MVLAAVQCTDEADDTNGGIRNAPGSRGFRDASVARVAKCYSAPRHERVYVRL